MCYFIYVLFVQPTSKKTYCPKIKNPNRKIRKLRSPYGKFKKREKRLKALKAIKAALFQFPGLLVFRQSWQGHGIDKDRALDFFSPFDHKFLSFLC